ncbi:MAG: polysaccharide deacetylase family protein [Patescibacteria group bacterium]
MQKLYGLHLSYHYFIDPGEKKPGVLCEKETFRKQCVCLKENNFQVLPFSEIVGRLNNNRPLPEHLASLSFDDGLRDGYEFAFPILKEFGFVGSFSIITCTLEGQIPPVIAFQILIGELGAEKIEFEIFPELLKGTAYATLLNHEQYDIRDAKKPEPPEMRRVKWIFNHFLPTSLQLDIIKEMFETYLGPGSENMLHKRYFIQPDEIREMANYGMDFCSHTVNHPDFTKIGTSEIEQELINSKAQLLEISRQDVTVFIWPFGATYSGKLKKVVAKYYSGAWNFGIQRGSPEDIMDLRRIDQADFQIY